MARATVTGCDGGTPPQDFAITDISSQSDAAIATKTGEQGYCLEMESSCVGEKFDRYFSPKFCLQPSTSSDIQSASLREEIPWQCPPDVPNPVVIDETTVDSDSSEPNNTDSATDQWRSHHHSESEQGCTTPSSLIFSDSDYSDSEIQLSDASTEL